MIQNTINVHEPTTNASYTLVVTSYGAPDLPPLLCVHGLTRNGQDFHFLAEHLSDTYHVLCPDMVGRGNSPWLDHAALYNNGFYAALISAWLAEMQLSTLRYIGTSMGGIIGMILAATQPGLIHRLVLNDIGMQVPASGLGRLKDYVGVNTHAATYDELAGRVAKNIAPYGIRDENILEHFIRASIEADPRGGYRYAYDPKIRESLLDLGKEDLDLSALWQAITCPTLLIRGRDSDLFLADVARAMQTSRAGVTLYEIPGVGHAPSLSSTEEFAHIREHLR